MKILLNFFILFVFSFQQPNISFKRFLSIGLDYVTIVVNAKCLYKSYSGKDAVNGEDPSFFDRSVSLVGGIPVVGYLKHIKELKEIGRGLKNLRKYLSIKERFNQNKGKKIIYWQFEFQLININ